MFARLFLPFLLVAALVCVAYGQADSSANPAAGAELRVMCFNIRNSNARDGDNHWRHRKDLAVSTIRAFTPDLLGLQEVVSDQFQDLQAALPDYTALGVARDDGKEKGERAPIFFRTDRFERVDGGDFWLSETPEEVGSKSWDAAYVRICTWVKLRDRATDQALIFANTHFDNEGAIARVRSAELLRERLTQLAKDAPIVLAGDFNCTEDDEAYRTLVGGADGQSGLQDSYRTVHPVRSRDEATFNGFKGTVAGSRIDWILHSPHFRATAAEIVRTTGERHVSDHYPITAVLELQQRGK